MRGLSPLPLVLLLSALGLPARAGPGAAPDAGTPAGPREFESYLLAAMRLYDSLDYERALEYLGRAKAKAGSVDEDVQVSLYEGIVLAELGRTDDSTAAFRAALLLKPDARLPLKVSPKVEEAFQLERERVQKELAARPRPPPARSPPVVAPPPAAATPPAASRPAAPAVRRNHLTTGVVGLLFGFYTLEYERVMDGNISLCAEAQLYNYQPADPGTGNALLRLAGLQGGVGIRFYLGSLALNGFYLSPQLDIAAGASMTRAEGVTTTVSGSNLMMAGMAGYSTTLFEWMAVGVGAGGAYGLGAGPLRGLSLRLRANAGVAF